jgi:hypothetical protein
MKATVSGIGRDKHSMGSDFCTVGSRTTFSARHSVKSSAAMRGFTANSSLERQILLSKERSRETKTCSTSSIGKRVAEVASISLYFMILSAHRQRLIAQKTGNNINFAGIKVSNCILGCGDSPCLSDVDF